MRNDKFRKGLVLVILVNFVVITVIPSTIGFNKISISIDNKISDIEIQNQYLLKTI